MKRTAMVLGLLLLAAPGCVYIPFLNDGGQTGTTSDAVVAKPRPPVTVDDVTEENAHDQAKALQAELDRALHQSEPDTKPTKVR